MSKMQELSETYPESRTDIRVLQEKAKAYDEALEKARQLCAYPTSKPFISDLQDLFPELNESEDERIRKKLIEFFKDWGKTRSHCWGIYIPDILAYLEKQKGTEREIEGNSLCNDEQKPVVSRFRVGDTIRNKKTNRLFYVHHLSEAGFLSLSDTNKTVHQGYLSENDFENYELVEQETAWSEEDESMLYGVMETEQYMLDVVNGIKKFDVGNASIKEDCTRELNWLKNRLKSLRPQNTWKPSSEQLIELRRVISGCSYDIEPLVELETKLKEL